MTFLRKSTPVCSKKRWLHTGFVRRTHWIPGAPVDEIVGVWVHVGSTLFLLGSPVLKEIQ